MPRYILLILVALSIALFWVTGAARADILINKASGSKVLDAHSNDVGKNGCRVQLWEWNNLPHQQWKLESVGDDFYKIVNQASGLVLDAHSNDVNKNGCRVQLWEYKTEMQQQWKLVKVGDYYKIINRASGKVLDAHSNDV